MQKLIKFIRYMNQHHTFLPRASTYGLESPSQDLFIEEYERLIACANGDYLPRDFRVARDTSYQYYGAIDLFYPHGLVWLLNKKELDRLFISCT